MTEADKCTIISIMTRLDDYVGALKANIQHSRASIAECEAAIVTVDVSTAIALREMIDLHQRMIKVRQQILDDLAPLECLNSSARFAA